MLMPSPLTSDAPVIVYLDIKSPYAYLAVEPARQLEKAMGVCFDWRPFVLDIPSYLGSARLGEDDQVLEQQRSDEQWAAVKYAYFDCRRYARLQGRTIRGTVKIWDTNLVSTAMLWLREYHRDRLPKFIDRVYAPFWIRELDVEREEVIVNLLNEAGVRGEDFLAWAGDGGLQLNSDFQQQVFALGIYGVPTFVAGGELLFGREHLPRVRWHLEGGAGACPDIAYSAPSVLPPSLHAPLLPVRRVVVGVDDSLDSLLALPALLSLLSRFTGEVCWTKLPPQTLSAVTDTGDQWRSQQHQQLRLQFLADNLRRYSPASLLSVEASDSEFLGLPERIGEAIQAFLRKHHLHLETRPPADALDPPMPGVAVMLDDELFIGRQHLPLLERRLLGVGPQVA